MKALVTLVRREFWEHRTIVIGTAVICVLYLALCLLAGSQFSARPAYFDSTQVGGGPATPVFFLGISAIFAMLLYGLMGVAVFAYFCDCLFTERKDRSILFWKSMPVSDSMTVLSKLLVGLVVLPLLALAFAMVTNLLAHVIFLVTLDREPVTWGVPQWLHLQALLLMDVLLLALWFAPVAAYQMLISAIVPRAPMLWTVLPPLVLVLGQRLFFNSWSIAWFIGDRLGLVVRKLPDNDEGGVSGLLGRASLIDLLKLPSLWVGLAVAAALLYGTIRIRRRRDDT